METSHTLESTTTTLEWKVTGLKKLFESSKGDVKSKVTRSVKFGGGQWQILFYPNSGTDNGSHLSLYLSCEPTAEEKEKASLDGKWVREGKFKFNFELCTIGKSTIFNRKEACDHSFNYKTANWGWAQFARRDAVYYNSSIVKQADAFLIHCEISCSPAAPHAAPQVPVQSVPKSLMTSIGDLLDNPLYSDVEFVFPPKRRGKSTRRIYAMKALLTRADYFRSLLDSGFAEGKAQTEDKQGGEEVTEEGEEIADTQTVQLAPESPVSSCSVYDSDFEDESDFEEEDGDGDGVETNLAYPTDVEMPMEEDRAVYSPTIENERAHSGLMASVEEDRGDDETKEETPTNGSPNLRTSWESLGASSVCLPPSNDSDSTQQVHSEGRGTAGILTIVPGPAKVKIVVSDVAYRTYLSMLHYLYTDNVVFAPLASTFSREEDKRNSTVTIPIPTTASSVVFEHSATTNRPKTPTNGATIISRRQWLRLWHSNNEQGKVGPCSAKAMYQLADKLNLLELKSRAFKHIIKSMNVQNIPHEMFSSFSARFEEVRKVQVDYFLTHWSAIRSSDAMASIWQQIRGGKHPGFEEVWPRIAMNLVFKPQAPPPEDEEVEVGPTAIGFVTVITYSSNLMEEAERVRLLSGLLLQSPPGEINDVLNDIRNIVTNDDALQEGIQPIIQQYNTEQFITVDLPEKDYQVIVSEAARVPGESNEQRFIDPRSKTSYKFDHLRLEASDLEPFELNADAEPLRSALEVAAIDYIGDHFYDGVATVLSSPAGEGVDISKFSIQIVGNKYNPNNYWSGRWRSSYVLDTKAGEVEAKIFIDVHYYEQGNVQLALSSAPSITLPPALVSSLSDTSSAKKILALIEAEETAFQSRLKEKIEEMSDKTFRGLRRLLPLTRQKVDWEKIMAYKLGAELNASKTAFGSAGQTEIKQDE